MSDTGDITAQVQAMLETGESSQETPPVETQQVSSEVVATSPTPEPLEDPSVAEFLKNVAEADRAAVSKYFRQWGANVTRRIGEVHKIYEPYKALGDAEQLAERIKFMEYLNTPKGQYETYLALQAHFKQLQGQNRAEDEEGFNPQPTPQNIPPELQIQLQQLQAVTNQLAQARAAEQVAMQQRQEDQALDQYMQNLRTEFGEFDEAYVIALMRNGVPGDQAVRYFHSMIQERINRANSAATAPPVLSGGQAAPQPTPRLGDLPSKDITSFVADIMSKRG